jgi:hypothetical protein
MSTSATAGNPTPTLDDVLRKIGSDYKTKTAILSSLRPNDYTKLFLETEEATIEFFVYSAAAGAGQSRVEL